MKRIDRHRWHSVAKIILASILDATCIILLLLAFLVALPHKPWLLYRQGLPGPDEVAVYQMSHQGRFPPLSNPARATYVVVDAQGASFFRQSALITPDRFFVFGGAEPGRFDMIAYRGIGMISNEEQIDLRSADGWLGFVIHHSAATRYSCTFSALQISMPTWFLGTIGAMPTVVVCAIAAARHRLLRQRLHNGLYPSCGYDVRATPDRCPECGKVLTLNDGIAGQKDEQV
jgi:hypothetical protein